MYGEDKTTIEELTNSVTELEKLKIEIQPKLDKTNELVSITEEIENKIKQVDEKILNSEDIEKANNELTAEDVSSNKTEFVISEDSILNTLVSSINVSMQKVDDAVKAEATRKAEEEKKAKEEAEKKLYVGTYKNDYATYRNTLTIKLDENGDLYFEENGKKYKIDINKKNRDGSIIVYNINNEYFSMECAIYPVGLALSLPYDGGENCTLTATDKNKIRLFHHGDDVPSITGNIYYKVD